MIIQQYPQPGRHILRYCGDILEIHFRTGKPFSGQAFLSTNIGNAHLRRAEIISQVEDKTTPGGQDWTNIPMEKVDDFTCILRLALTEPGHFEFKCCIVPEDGSEPLWAPGDNVHLNVEPTAYCASNSVYCAFVRQFGTNKNKTYSTLPAGLTAEKMKELDDLDFALIPPSGTFRDLIGELDHIVYDLKCRIVHLLPVNPTPTVYGRMGRYGSPYASLDFTGIDPALAEFDRKATPLDQFIELADEIHKRDAKLFIDIAINHTGWAAKLHETHPDWLLREPDGTIHSPGAWGVVWGDLTELDHNKLELWKYLADAFLTWCARGVDGFRCDAGYMIPAPAWQYIVSRVRNEYPDTIFLLEGLGGDPAVTRNLLDAANMNWAYSELFQNYSRDQIQGYLNYAWGESGANGIMIHYAETHDNNRLAAVSAKYASMRTALSALTSVSGAFGFANGVEWFAKEKIDVHEASGLNWGAAENQINLIRRLNVILGLHPAFFAGAVTEFVDCGTPDAVLFTRTDADGKNGVLVAVNLNCDNPATLAWRASNAAFLENTENAVDLISGKMISRVISQDKVQLTLSGGKFVCLSAESGWLDKFEAAETKHELALEPLYFQLAKMMALRTISSIKRSQVMVRNNADDLAKMLLKSPEGFLKYIRQRNVLHWNWPQDTRRNVMIPPGFTIVVTAPDRFRMSILDGEKIVSRAIGIRDDSGRYFALIPPIEAPSEQPRQLTMKMRVFEASGTRAASAPLLLLAQDTEHIRISFDRKQLFDSNSAFVQANGRGAIIHQRMGLEKLESRYDAILLANLSPDCPVDRHIMWRRIRLWVIRNARRQELKHEHIHSFHIAEDGGGVWDYLVPVGNGMFIELCVKMQIVENENAVLITIFRHPAGRNGSKRLPDETPVQVIVRPDIEDRNFHYSTKAAQGPEHYWPGQISAGRQSFDFNAASDRILHIQASKGSFIRKDQWLYMIYQQNEAARGLDPHTDLYSPGIFKTWLSGSETVLLSGQILTSPGQEKIKISGLAGSDPFRHASDKFEDVILRSLRAFVAKRDDLKTVIAGYPWFLDWGRDTLIAARGLVMAPEFRDDVKKILLRFAQFEENGTIPNMISGNNADNRDTSDAPLWLFTAVDDLCREEKSYDFLKTVVRKDQTLLDILTALAEGIMRGTPNGIKCDPASNLVFSPPHFTWMDTNYPAGTPREGYPIEIQALWYAAQAFLAKITGDKHWKDAAEKTRQSILTLYPLKAGYLSDCLHAKSGTPAARAVADDHIRPNQLFAITLGAVPVGNRELCLGILNAAEKLLVPGAIRSLADEDTEYALPVYGATGALLNDPHHPYRGRYEGDEDTSRKVAYHNGTAWTWPFPSFPEACFMVFGDFARPAAAALLASMTVHMNSGALAHVPEIIDGDFPHTPRGCDAQAWGITEFYRVWKLLQ